MKILGVSALSHDASFTLLEEGHILMASHSERFSRIKNDPYISDGLMKELEKNGRPDVIVWYEKPWKKKSRQMYAGQWKEALDLSNLPKNYLKKFNFKNIPIEYVDHHLSHAAGGFFTSGFQEAVVVVIDAIGEWDTISIWKASEDGGLKCLKKIQYPYSLGLLYSAFTQRCGLRPNEEEFILMGMAAYGEPIYKEQIKLDFFEEGDSYRVKRDFHRGVGDYLAGVKDVDLAASIQALTQEVVLSVVKEAKALYPSENLVYSGGVALNCLINQRLYNYFPNVWIMPNPGDAGSSLGAAAAFYGKPLNWKSPYLGTNIPGEYPVKPVLSELLKGNIVGVASGRAEFGPRALGNRSLLADPRAADGKDKVNEIKKRQKFRPFAPVILEEKAKDYFEMACDSSPYMQFVFSNKYPKEFPGITHVDGSSRVQTVNEKQHPGLYELLCEFEKATGCPMLLNTSLNIRGEPLVNISEDALRFENKHRVPVF